MAGLTRKQEAAIVALLAESTLQTAAATAGIGETTLYRWLQDEGFQAAYRAARRQVVEKAVTELQGACGEAVATLCRNLTADSANAQIRAAQIILEQAFRGVELYELAQRLEALESYVEETKP
jgi:hypothetical protein